MNTIELKVKYHYSDWQKGDDINITQLEKNIGKKSENLTYIQRMKQTNCSISLEWWTKTSIKLLEHGINT